jgi:hypothetical protein
MKHTHACRPRGHDSARHNRTQMRNGTTQDSAARHSTTRHNTTQHDTTQHNTISWYRSQCPHQIDTAVVRVAAAENERKSERIAFGFIVPFARTLSTPAVPSRRQQQQRSRLIHRQRVGLRVEYPLVQRQHRWIVTKQQIKILQRLACAATHAFVRASDRCASVRNRAQDARRTQTLGTMTSQVATEGSPCASWRAGVGSTT